MSAQGSEHESAFVSSFIRKERRDRIAGLLTPKRRHKWRKALGHMSDLDERKIIPISSHLQHNDEIETLLRQRGAPDICWLMSETEELDGVFMPLHAALAVVVGYQQGSIISCVPGKLAYYEGEDKGFRVILTHA